MRNIIFTLLCCLCPVFIFAQEVVSTAGQQTKNSTASLCWTIGEPVTKTVGNGDNILTQGQHQSNLEITALNEIEKPDFSVNVYPNPVTDYVELSVDRDSKEDLSCQLFDSNGKLILEKELLDNKTTICTNDLLPAIYFLTVRDNQKSIQTFQIIKK